ncbi:terpene synthase family protein [Streptomyces sp. NPDC003077]|uniref:terpene synthase family protein n=1 Tax=Streptomyces sp. NPDC003077 TaxID=3154443 RepID=UPI0033A29CB2
MHSESASIMDGYRQRQSRMPFLSFPHTSSFSPYYLAVRARAHDWFIAAGVVPDNSVARFLNSDYTQLTAMIHPACDAERLEKLTRYYLLWFAMEERDEELWQEQGGVRRFYKDVIAYLDSGETDSTDPWLVAYAQTVEDLCLSPRLRERHRVWKKDWLEGEIRVADYGNTPHPNFMEDRHKSIGVMVALSVLCQYGLGVDLPDSVLDHDDMHAFLGCLVRVSSWQSDILTLDAEQARGEVVNTVNVLMAQHNLSQEEGINQIYRRYREDLARAYTCLGVVLGHPWEADQGSVDAYCNSALDLAYGFLRWNQLTDRYVPGIT